jgi:putative phosphoesterase
MAAEIRPRLRRYIDRSIGQLASEEFHGVFSRETVARVLEESAAQIGERPTVGPNFLPVIIERSRANGPGARRRPDRATPTDRRAPVTRVAVITDIHANLPALDASLAAIAAIGIDDVFCGGDLVGYGPHPNEVCRLIETRGIPTIYGNYDHAIARDQNDCGCAYVTQHDRELGQRSVAWTLANTDQRSKQFMRGLPFDLRFEVADKRVRLVHGSPRKVNEYLFEEKPARLYERLAAQADCDVLVFGHTHKPWIHEYGGVRFVNCGSVGKPKDGDPRAAFAILDLDPDGDVRASIVRVPYDAESVARAIAAAGLPGEYAEKLVAAA